MNIFLKEHKRKDGSFLGEVVLNRPEALNAINYEMASLFKEALKKWREDSKIKLVFLHSSDGRSFSAGGDIKALYHQVLSARGNNQDPGLIVQPFFEKEYPVNYIMRTYPKPIVTWGQGFVMGGGFGLLTASSHPIVTETSLLAMPEIKIGFFPDVGGSHFLSRLANDMGWYLGLTGCTFNSAEFLYLGLGELFLKDSDKEALLQYLLSGSFKDGQELTEQLKFSFKEEKSLFSQNRLQVLEESIQSLIERKDIESIYSKMQSLPVKDTFWLTNKEAFLKGSPTSLAVLCEQLHRGKKKTLKEVCQMEMVMALQFIRHFDFMEGIRALLIDKTKTPNWNPDSIEKLNSDWIEKHFEPKSGWINPLDSL